jgi:hypothetical protein
VGYIFEKFNMTSGYQTLYLQGVTATGTRSGNQTLNTLDGYYNDYTAHMIEALVQYKF